MSVEAPGVETIFYSVDTLIEDEGIDDKGNPKEFFLKPVPFGKRMKKISIHDSHNLLPKRDIRNFQNQLIKVALYWNDTPRFGVRKLNGNKYEWFCEETGSSSSTKLKFTPKRIED